MRVFINMALLFVICGNARADEELLDPKIAFVPSGFAISDNELAVKYKIAEGYYLYKHGFKFSAPDGDIELGEAKIPSGKKKVDEWFGEVETYRNEIVIKLPFKWITEKSELLILQVTAQGCADIGVCFPPQKQFIEIKPSDIVVLAEATIPLSEQDRIAATLSRGTSIITLLTFFGFGLLLAFTPCVFPMIPILSGIIIGQGKLITTRKAFLLSSVYVLAMALTYTVAGVVVGLSGENVQVMFQNPWVLGTFAAVFVLLSLSMFGFYELQMPASIQSRLTSFSNKQQGGTLIGAAIMGFLSALIVGPCVTAPLIGALIYIAHTGDAVLGGAALFSLSLGMGAPLIIIGTSAGKLIPRAGKWMNAVKALFGVLLLAIAVWLLSRVIPETVTMILYAILSIGSAVYMGALEPRKESSNNWSPFWKGIGLILLLYGTILIVGAGIGGGTVLQPLRGLQGTSGNAENITQHGIVFRQFKGVTGLQQVLDEAQKSKQPVMLDLYADWCISCKEMEAFTFTDTNVQASLKPFILIQADVTANDDEDKALLKKLGVFGPPAIVFYDRDGNEIEGTRVVGYMKAKDFDVRLQQILNRI
ncbi:MAG: protein-disulfide reductase DsbD [Gammaproteobacteria bacterium]|nr:protein-disulfide reductase DsbD [Gammaproteobacteria bacterium]